MTNLREADYIKTLDVLHRRMSFSGGRLSKRDKGAYDYIKAYLGAVETLTNADKVKDTVARLSREMK